MKPEVSVILLCYNQQATIARAIDSILAQKVTFPYEIIIGDDDSVDDTRLICQHYADCYPHIIRLMPHAPNKGLVRNYQDAFSMAQGRFIADCSGDDYWLGTDSLQRKYSLLTENDNVVLVHTDWSENRPECVVKAADIAQGKQMMHTLLSTRAAMPLHLSTVLYRADIVRDACARNPRLLFSEEMGCEDLPILCALLDKGDAMRLEGSTLLYSTEGESISRSSSAERAVDFHLRSSMAIKKLARHYGVYDRPVRRRIMRKMHYALSRAIEADSASLLAKIDESVSRYALPLSLKSRLKRLLKGG